MSYKKLLKLHTTGELAESFVFPVKYSLKQQAKADKELTEARQKSQAIITEQQKRYANLLQLKFQLEDYVNSNQFNPAFTFGYFLERYLEINQIKKKDFARDIQIHDTLLSHLINNQRGPNDSIVIRLELHSNKIIPAIYWYKLAEKEKEHYIRTDDSIRNKESQYVTHSLRPLAHV